MFYSYTRGAHPEVYVPTLVESEQVEITPEGNDDYPLDVTGQFKDRVIIIYSTLLAWQNSKYLGPLKIQA